MSNNEKIQNASRKLARPVSDTLRAAALRVSGLGDRFGSVNAQMQILFRMVADMKQRVEALEKESHGTSSEEER